MSASNQSARSERYAREHKFWADLLANREYRTPPGREAAIVRWLPWLARFHFHAVISCILSWGGVVARFNRYDELHWAKSGLDIMNAIERSGGKFVITGLSNVASPCEAMVIISNHMSAIEPYILGTLVLPFRDMAFIMKDTLLTYPFVGPLMKAIRPIPVGRQNPRADFKQVIERGVPTLKAGRSIVVFPESTRTVTFDTTSFNSLGTKLAVRAGVPVVPLAVKSDLLRNGRLIKDMGPIDTSKTIYFEFGAPLRVEGNGREQHKQVVSFIAERLKRWGAKIVTEQPVGAIKG